jgi:hypothetical protein
MNITDLKSDLRRKVPNIDNITGVNDLIEEAARNVLSRIDPQSTLSSTYATQPFYDSIYDYAIASDVKAIVQISPVETYTGFYAPNIGLQDFTINNDRSLSIGYRNGLKTLKANTKLGDSPTLVSDMETLSQWATYLNGTNVALDTQFYLAGSHSISFGITSGGSGGVTFTPTDSFNIGTYSDMFLAIYTPNTTTAGYVDTLTLTLTADDGGTYAMTATSPFNKSSFELGWNIVRFNLATAVETATLSEDISSVRLSIANTDNNTIEGLRIDSLTLNTSVPFQVTYYSDALFRDTSGIFSTQISDDSDLINLDTDSYNILLYEASLIATEELEDRSARWERYDIKLNAPVKGLYPLYNARYGTQRLEEGTTYYNFGNTGSNFSSSRIID